MVLRFLSTTFSDPFLLIQFYVLWLFDYQTGTQEFSSFPRILKSSDFPFVVVVY